MSTQTRQEIESAPRQDAFGCVLMVLADCRERYEPKDAEWRALADATEAIHRLLDVRAVLTESRDACQRENSRLALAKQAAEQQVATLTDECEQRQANWQHLLDMKKVQDERVATLTEALVSAQRVILQGDVPYKDEVLAEIAVALAAVRGEVQKEIELPRKANDSGV